MCVHPRTLHRWAGKGRCSRVCERIERYLHIQHLRRPGLQADPSASLRDDKAAVLRDDKAAALRDDKAAALRDDKASATE